MTRLVIISDTHSLHAQMKYPIPEGDLLIHCGDWSNDIGQADLRSFLKWFEAQPHKTKAFVSGNHDGATQLWPDLARAMIKELAPSAVYLQDSEVNLCGLTLWGSPYTPTFFNWYHMRDRGQAIKRHWDMIPDHVDVLVTHGPPYSCLDVSGFVQKGEDRRVGCKDLLEAIKRVKPRVHCFGHIHHSHGTQTLVHDDGAKTILINASICNEAYLPFNAPWVIDL